MGINKYFNRKETGSLIIASLVLGFVFSFRQWGYEEFSFSIGIANWIRSFFLSFIVLSIYVIANKNSARVHGATATFRVWNIERFWFSKGATISKLSFLGFRFRSFTAGVFIPILLALFTNGLVKFAAVGYTELKEVRAQRAGKKFRDLTDFETARTHLAGPMTVLLVAVLLSSFSSFNSLVDIAKLVAIYSFLPFSKLDGSKILFGSLYLYVFALLFAIGSILLLSIIPPLATIFLALAIAIFLILVFLYRTY